MVDEVKIKLIGSSDDVDQFLKFLCLCFDDHVLSSRAKQNDAEPGVHCFAYVRMTDLKHEFRGGRNL